jgi:hypothetical protein
LGDKSIYGRINIKKGKSLGFMGGLVGAGWRQDTMEVCEHDNVLSDS